jgi:hypothetical protein
MNPVLILLSVFNYFVKPSRTLIKTIGHTEESIQTKPLWIRLLLARVMPVVLVTCIAAFGTEDDFVAARDLICSPDMFDCGASQYDTPK